MEITQCLLHLLNKVSLALDLVLGVSEIISCLSTESTNTRIKNIRKVMRTMVHV